MKRKFYLLFTALLMMAASSAWAYDFIDYAKNSQGLAFNKNSDNTSVTVTYKSDVRPFFTSPQANEYNGDIIIPVTVDYEGKTYDVTAIGQEAFRFATITSVTFEEGTKVTNIGEAAFNNCNNLTEIEIPNSVTKIDGDGVLANCGNLKKVTIGSGVNSIGSYFLSRSSSVASIYVYTKSVPTASTTDFTTSSTAVIHVYSALADDFKATSPWKDAGTIVGDLDSETQFRDATQVKIGDLYYNLSSAGTATVTYPNSKEPGEDNPSSYTGDITIPASIVDENGAKYTVTSIGGHAFQWSTINSVTFEEGVQTIEYAAFSNCHNITNVVLPNSVTSLTNDAFSMCYALKSLTIGKNFKTFAYGCLYNCSALTDVYINTEYVPANNAALIRSSATIHVNHNLVDSFKVATNWSSYSYIGDIDEATLNYKIGARIKGRSGLSNGDLVVIQAASSSKNYNYFIKETTDNSFKWAEGFDSNSVWRVVSTGTANHYYFRNVKSGRYMRGTSATSVSTSETTDDYCKFIVQNYNIYTVRTYSYTDSNPRGWDEYSVEFQNEKNWWLRNDTGNSKDGTFGGGDEHNYHWNLFKAEIDDEGSGSDYIPGTAITSVSDIKPDVSYVLATNGRGDVTFKEDSDNPIAISNTQESYKSIVASTKAGFNQWVFRPAGNMSYYLYNVAAGKYLSAIADNTGGELLNKLTDNPQDAMTLAITSVPDGTYTFLINVPEGYLNNRRLTVWNGGVYLNNNTANDDVGTRIQIIEAFDFDPSVFESTTVPSFTLADKVDYTPPTYSFTATSATYTRDMKSGVKWGTVMLPYAVSATSDVKFYEITSLTNDELTVTETTNGLTAGTPALFKRTNTSSSTITFSANDVEVVPDVNDATSGSVTLKGVYAADKITDAYYIANDKFWSGSFHIYPFRAYLTGSAGSNAFSILVDDDPTGITSAAITADASDEIEGVYSVSGVKLSDLQKGINIIRYRSGKTQKVILK